MEQWRNTVVEALAATPQEWRPLGEIFRLVADDLPLHVALRRAASSERSHRRRRGDDRPVEATDLDLISAQWNLFSSFVLPLVERQSARKRRALRTEHVRLRVYARCAVCAGPTYLTGWVSKGCKPQHACPLCSRGEPIPEPPRPKLTLVVPPPEPGLTFTGLALLGSIDEIWDAFVKTAAGRKRFAESRKLRWMLHRALEAGAANEFKRMSLFKISEYQALGYPTFKTLDQVLYWRAGEWLVNKTPTLTREEREIWADLIGEAYRFGCLCVVSMTVHDRLSPITSELDGLVVKLEDQPQRQRAPPKRRWRGAFKNVARFRMR